MSTKKGVYRGRNVDDGSSGSLAGRAPLPEDRQLNDRNDQPTASTSGTSRPKGNYNPSSSSRDDGGRRSDDRSRGRYDDRDRDRARERDRDRNRDRDRDRDRVRDDRSSREDKFAKQRAPPVQVSGKGDYKREDRDARAGAAATAGSRRQRESDDGSSSYYPRRENGATDHAAQTSDSRENGQDWQNKRPRLDESGPDSSGQRRFNDSDTKSSNNTQENAKGKGVYTRTEDRDRDNHSTTTDKKETTERRVWPPPGWDDDKDRNRGQRYVPKAKKKGEYTRGSRRSPSPVRDVGRRQDNGRGGRGRDRDRDRDRSRRSSRSRSRSISRSPGAVSSLRTGRSVSPASSTRSFRTGHAAAQPPKSRWDIQHKDNAPARGRSRSRTPAGTQAYPERGAQQQQRPPSPPSTIPPLTRPISPGAYDPSRPSHLPFAQPPPPQHQIQWPPHGQAAFPNMPPDQQHQMPPPHLHMQQPPPQHQQFPPNQQHHQLPQHQQPPPLPAWPPQPPLHVDPRHFPMPPNLNNGQPPPITSQSPYNPTDGFPSREPYPPSAEAYQSRRDSYPAPDAFPSHYAPNPNQYPPPPGQFPPLPSQFPGMLPQHSPQPHQYGYPTPYPPPSQLGLHEGPSAADRNLSISFRQSPPIGMSQSPPGSMQGLPDRQLSAGIRAPPPGPNKGGGGKFKPIAGFVPIGSVTPPVDRGQLGRFFPGDDAQEDNSQKPSDPQASAAVQQLEEEQTSAWARWEAPTASQPPAQNQPPVQSMTVAQPNTPGQPQQQQTSQAQTPSFIPLPTAHAPVFPGLDAFLPAAAKVNGGTAEPSSPGKDASKVPPVGLPLKPNFASASNLMPAFLPQKPTPPASTAGTPAQSALPPPPIPLPSPATTTTSPTTSLAQGEGLPAALARFKPRMMNLIHSRPQKASEALMDNASPQQEETGSTPQTPGQGADASMSGQEVSQSAQPSPAPSETASSKQPEVASQTQAQAEAAVATADMPSAQEQAASQPAPRVVSSELYERLAQVGEGTYGKVYKARRQDTGKLVALKRIRMEAEKDGFPVTAIREIKLLQSLDHPNVLKLMEMMVSKGHVYMVSEYLEHDLTGILNNPNMQSNKFTDANLKSLMQQLLAGLDYIHWRGVLHRDLKGSNILLGRNGDLKIADFGLAKFYDKRARNDYTNRVITLWYKPPELLFGETVYGPEVDMWSAGCIFLELFTKKPVFQGQDELHQLDVIFRYMGTPSTETWPEVTSLPWYELVKPKHSSPSQFRETFAGTYLKSPLAIELAEALLSFNPSKRPTASEALLMPYFTSDDEPKAEKPTWLADIKGDWHEMESKEANKRKGREARKAAHHQQQQQQQQQQMAQQQQQQQQMAQQQAQQQQQQAQQSQT